MSEHWFGLSNIAGRLRAVLLTVAVLVLAQPVFIYFATNRIAAEQQEVTDKLTGTVVQTTRLNKELDRVATESRALRFQENVEELNEISRALTESIDGLISEFAGVDEDVFSNANNELLINGLKDYKALIESETEANADRLSTEENLAQRILETRTVSTDMQAVIGNELANTQILLNRQLAEAGQQTNQIDVAKRQATLSRLITLNTIAETVTAKRFSVVAIERVSASQRRLMAQSRTQLLMRNLATQIAKLPEGRTRRDLASTAIRLNELQFGQSGIYELFEARDLAAVNAQNIVSDRQALTTSLLSTTQNLVEDLQRDVVTASNAATNLLTRTRLYLVATSALAAILIMAAIMFVVERQFNRRISKLTRRVLAIADGDDDVGAAVAGNDELSAMNDALAIFKQNAAELRDANQTLATKNTQIRQISGRLQTILDTTSSGIIAFDDVGQIILVNKPARHFIGGISDAAPFERPRDLKFLNREDLSPLDESSDPINRVIAGQNLNNEIALMERAGGGDGRYVRITSNRVDTTDSVVRAVMAIDDVSVAEQNRQQIERASRLDALGQLTGGIAHDFNNLLATIQYAVQLSADSSDTKTRDRFTKIALESVDRGSNLSNRLLSFAKRQPGISKSLLIEKVIEDFHSLIGPTLEKFITIKFTIEEPGMSVFCDGAQLENALLNLVLNARDAILRSGSGNEISIAVRGVAEISAITADAEPDRYLTDSLAAELQRQADQHQDSAYRFIEFSVTDNGPGMNDEVKRRALDPFFTTKSTNSGTGLGLSMVYGFVQQSGGELRIYSEVGHGTTMRLLLPRGSTADTREEPITRALPRVGGGQTILIIDDEPHLLEAMQVLVDSLGYKTEVAQSAQIALDRVDDGLAFDLLLTDIVMPGGIGGFDLAEQIRKRRPDVPVIYMSGYAAYSQNEMGAVVAPLLQKPCAPKDLAEHLSKAFPS